MRDAYKIVARGWAHVDITSLQILSEQIAGWCQVVADSELAEQAKAHAAEIKLKDEQYEQLAKFMRDADTGELPTKKELDEQAKAHEFNIAALQSKIDALMLEFCSNKMNQAQRDKWAESQKVSEPNPVEGLTDDEIKKAMENAEGNCGAWPYARAAIAADRAKQSEVKPKPVSITGRFCQLTNGAVVFVRPESYLNCMDGRFLEEEQTRIFR